MSYQPRRSARGPALRHPATSFVRDQRVPRDARLTGEGDLRARADGGAWRSDGQRPRRRSMSRLRRPVRHCGLPRSQRGRPLLGLPDGHEVPPPGALEHEQVLRRAPAPIGHEERLGRRPPGAPKVLGSEPHGRDLATTHPAGEPRALIAGSVEPGGWGHAAHATAHARRPPDGPIARLARVAPWLT
jgi:hypothetical protein